MIAPEEIQAIGQEIAIRWSDGSEDYLRMEYLRSRSPSAENVGERDLTGQVIYGGSGPKEFPGVRVVSWQTIGSYAVQFRFSDGHNTGIYGFDYLKRIASEQA